MLTKPDDNNHIISQRWCLGDLNELTIFDYFISTSLLVTIMIVIIILEEDLKPSVLWLTYSQVK